MIAGEAVGAVGRIVEATVDSIEAECLSGCAPPPLGALLTTLDGDPPVYAAVTAIHTTGIDPSRPVVPHGEADEDLETVLRRNPHLPLLLRVGFSAAIIAHRSATGLRYLLPESPPPLLARMSIYEPEQTARFAEGLDALEPLVRAAPSNDDVVAAFLRRAADASADRRAFLLAAGRRLVPLLSDEPDRLVAIVRRIRP